MFKQIILQIILIAFNAVFAAAEIALLSLSRARLEKEAEGGRKAAKRLLRLLDAPSGYLAMIQVGVTVSGFLGSAFAADGFARRAGAWLCSLGLPASEAALQTAALVAVTLAFSYVTMVLGELFPKRLAMRKTEALAYALSPFLALTARLFSPLIGLLSGSVNLLLRLCRVDPDAPEDGVTEEEIRLMVGRGGTRGAIRAAEKQMIENVFEFDDKSAGDLMTHRLDAALLWLKDGDEAWFRDITGKGRGFYPVCGETVDDIAGLLDTRAYLLLEDRGRASVMAGAVKTPQFVPETMKADVLFRKMKESREHAAIVLDEYGGFSGVITIQDLLEALVGDFERDSRARSASALCYRYRAMSIYSDFLQSGTRPLRLCFDSRDAAPGSLYFALCGLHTDGHLYVDEAIRRGATHIVHQNELPHYLSGARFLKVADSRFAMSPIADEFYGSPSRKMTVIGVTGTEGKSTVVSLIFQLLTLCGRRAGFISTVGYATGGAEYENRKHQTTPEAPVIHEALDLMVRAGSEFAVIEASSHGLSPRTNRLGDVAFDAAVMTNVRHEHLEFHGSWEAYRDDKARLFRSLGLVKKPGVEPFGVVNGDDPCAAYFAAATEFPVFRFGAGNDGGGADALLGRVDAGGAGNVYDALFTPPGGGAGEPVHIEDALPGRFNAENVLAALLTVSRLTGKSPAALAALVPQLKPVRGRMSPVDTGRRFEAYIDYAHTPSSFEAVLPPALSRARAKGGRLIAVFGSAGERDTQKRPLQGELAGRFCDIVILADEDPRGENPERILEEIAAGVKGKTRDETLFLIPPRHEAVRKAFSLARKDDVVLLLGKGHETGIIYADGEKPYDEFAAAEEALSALAASPDNA